MVQLDATGKTVQGISSWANTDFTLNCAACQVSIQTIEGKLENKTANCV